MPAGPKLWTEERIAERFAAGRGQGARELYAPWVRVQEFASRGNQTRVPSVHLRRSIHTFSYLERSMYFWHEFQGFEDYREQLPLDRRITLGAAELLQIRHPVYPDSKCPFVMMLDALVFRKRSDGKLTIEAWDAKPKNKLESPRIREKLTLHVAFCKVKGIPHRMFTEDTVPKTVLRNIEWARGALPVEDELLTTPEFFTRVAEEFLAWLQGGRHRRLIWEICMHWDNLQRFEYGTALRLFKFLMWHRRIHINLQQEDIPHSHLPIQGLSEQSLNEHIHQRRA